MVISGRTAFALERARLIVDKKPDAATAAPATVAQMLESAKDPRPQQAEQK